MKLYTELMSEHNLKNGSWVLFVDVECESCKKNQSLVNYRCNGNKCIKCGSEIKL